MKALRSVSLLLLLVATQAIGPAAHAYAQSSGAAGTSNLLASPGSWPTTGALSGTTALGLDPSAVYLNPAGLADQDAPGVHLLVDLALGLAVADRVIVLEGVLAGLGAVPCSVPVVVVGPTGSAHRCLLRSG